MTETPFVTASDVERRARVGELIDELDAAVTTGALRRVVAPARQLLHTDEGVFGSMAALSADLGLFVTKTAAFVRGRENGASVQALAVALSTRTGRPLAIFDGAAITSLKCASLAGLVTKRRTARAVDVLGVIGSGAVARAIVRGVLAVRTPREVRIFSRSVKNAQAMIDDVAANAGDACRFVVAESAREAVHGADIVGTGTTSAQPILDEDWLSGSGLVLCMGAHTRESREIDHAALGRAELLVEDRATAIAEAGAVHEVARELADLADREPRGGRTVFSSTGHAVFDLFAVAHVLRNAPSAERGPDARL